MPYKSRWSIPIPDCSLPSFLFGSASHTEQPQLANKKAYIDAAYPDTQYFTRKGFKLWSQRFALGLTRMPGFKRGDRVLVFSGNNLGFPVAFMGILMAGGIFTAANPTFVSRELANQLRDSEAAYVLCAEASLDTVVEAAKAIGLTKDRIMYFDTDVIFQENGTNKPNLKGVEYWSKVFAAEDEARSYQWPELKGESSIVGSILMEISNLFAKG